MDLWTEFLGFLSQIVTPIWETLIQYIPLLLLGLIPLVLLLLVGQWRRHGPANASRVPPRLPDGRAPEGLHLPSPSKWPFIAPIGLFFIFLGLVLGGEAGPDLLLLSVGLIIGAVAFAGWLMDATHEYDATQAGAHGLVLVAETDGRRVEPPIPEGVHLPPPSAWPLLAPIGLFFVFLGLVLGPVLIVGGFLMAAIAAVGWLLDAGREYREVAEGAHADPALRDPERAFPKRLTPVYASIAAISIVLTLAPWMLTWLPQSTDVVVAGGPEPTTTPYLSAVSVLSFEQDEIAVPADTPFTITFENKQAGVPHNVEIFTDADRSSSHFQGELITGPATIDYAVPPLGAGEYPFICTVHPPMTGTLIVQ